MSLLTELGNSSRVVSTKISPLTGLVARFREAGRLQRAKAKVAAISIRTGMRRERRARRGGGQVCDPQKLI